MATLYDNIENYFKDGLYDLIARQHGAKRIDMCVGYFNLRGWNHIEDVVDTLDGADIYEFDEKGNDIKIHRTVRLLIGMHRPDEDLLRMLYSKKSNLMGHEDINKGLMKIVDSFRKQLLIGSPSTETEKTLRHLSKQMKEGKVSVKLYLKYPLHAKLYIVHYPEERLQHQTIMGSSNLTYSGLQGNGELNSDFTDSDHAKKMADWFDDRWNDRQAIDITQQLIRIIDESWAGEKTVPPYYIYLKTAYHLSREARNGIREFDLSDQFRKELFVYQQNAVQIAAKHLANDKLNGAMIGDVVGLGKTLTACAIAKIFEERYLATTLIICPANLQDMWQKYIKKYDLKAVVQSMQKNIDVENARYYRLVIVDESHNLRNSDGKRYQNIKSLIEKQDSKVLLLTATPYNKDFSDLANQLKLFLDENQDLGIRPENYIRFLGGEYQFGYKHSDIDIRSIRAFEKSESTDDWNELMKLFLVRRTRAFIKNNYAQKDDNGRYYLLYPNGDKFHFPTRIPKAIKFKTEEGDQYSRLYSEEMIKLINELNLPRYGLLNYYDNQYENVLLKHEKQLIDNLSKAGERMMGFARSTFFKRIDSDGYSFLLTICRHILRNALYYHAIQNNLDLPIGDTNSIYNAFSDEDESFGESLEENRLSFEKDGKLYISTNWEDYLKRAKEYYSLLKSKNNCSWISSRYFKPSLKTELKTDSLTLIKMINQCGEWDPNTDQKLNSLYELITKTHGKEKVLIFTQFADTANYISHQLKKRGIKNIEVATGDSKNPTELAEKFSPVSNEVTPPIPFENQTRILIATDVLSEGQNLQDSHIIVNFDLPWAIIRLIQRAGRVDRIGQKAEEIYCYSFFPAEGVENIINLRSTLNKRINENARVLGSDEIFFEGNEQNLRDMFNEKSGILDNDDDTDVDLGSMAYEIWNKAIKKNPELAKIIPDLPDMSYTTKEIENPKEEGVVTYTRTFNDFDVLTWLDKEGNVISQSQKKILQAMECSYDTPALQPLNNHHKLVEDAIDMIASENKNMGGVLGKPFSVKARLHKLLMNYLDAESKADNLFFDNDKKESLKLAIHEIYNYPMIETTRTSIGRMLNNHKPADEIVDYVIEHRGNGNLCNIPKEDREISKDPKIICSMGLRCIS